MESLTLRTATDDDWEVLYYVIRSTLREYVEQTWGVWEEEQQRAHFAGKFIPERIKVVQLNGDDIGLLHVDRSSNELFISEIEILPDYQGRGIGTTLLRDLFNEATARELSVRLQVLKVNPARRLYERLGFRIIDETKTHFMMRWEL